MIEYIALTMKAARKAASATTEYSDDDFDQDIINRCRIEDGDDGSISLDSEAFDEWIKSGEDSQDDLNSARGLDSGSEDNYDSGLNASQRSTETPPNSRTGGPGCAKIYEFEEILNYEKVERYFMDDIEIEERYHDPEVEVVQEHIVKREFSTELKPDFKPFIDTENDVEIVMTLPPISHREYAIIDIEED